MRWTRAPPPKKKGAVAVGAAAAFRMFAASETSAPSTRLPLVRTSRRRRVTKTQVPLVAGPTAGLPRPRTAPVRVVQATPAVRVANTAPPPLRGVTPRAKDPTFDLEPISTPSAYMMPIHEAGLDLFACPTPPASNCPTPTCPL